MSKTKDRIILEEFCQSMMEKLDKIEMQYIKDAMDAWGKQDAIAFAIHLNSINENKYDPIYIERVYELYKNGQSLLK